MASIKFAPSYAKYAEVRDAKGLTDSAVADGVGITASSLSDWKLKGAVINADKLYRISTYLGVTVESLMEEKA